MEAHSAVAYLKQDLELILSSPLASNSTDEDFHSIRKRVKLMDGLLRNNIRKTDEEFQTLSNKVNWEKWSHSNTVEEMNDEFGNIVNLVGWLRENAIGENFLPGRMRDVVDNLKKNLWNFLCKDKIREPHYNIPLMEMLLQDSFGGKLVDCMKHDDTCIHGEACLMESFPLDTSQKKDSLMDEISVVHKKHADEGKIPWELDQRFQCFHMFQKYYYKLWLIEWLLMYSMGKRYLDSEIRAVLNSMKRILKNLLIHFNKLHGLYFMVYWMERQVSLYYNDLHSTKSKHSHHRDMMEVLYFFKLVVKDCEPLFSSDLVQKFHDEACSLELVLTDADSSMARKTLISMVKILVPDNSKKHNQKLFVKVRSMEKLLADINSSRLLFEIEESEFQKLYEKALLMQSLLTDSFVKQFCQCRVIKEMVRLYMEDIEKDQQPIKLVPAYDELDRLIPSLFSYSSEENYFQSETIEESLISQEDVIVSIKTDLEELKSLIGKTQLPILYRDICSDSNQHLPDSNFQRCIGFVNSTKEDILKYLKKPLHFSYTFKKIIPYICLLEYFISCKSSNLRYQVQDWILICENYLCKEMERLIYKEFKRLHQNVHLIDLLPTDSLGKNCNQLNILSVSEIQDVAQRASYYINYKNQQEVFIELEEFDSDRLTLAKESEAFGLSSNHTMTSLLKVREEIVSINQKLKIILFNAKRKVLGTNILQTSQNPASTTGSSSTLLKPSPRSANNNVKLVGHDKELEAMLDCLTGQSLALQVFPIIGMAGIGKTTFADELYDHPLVIEKFDIRAWATVSQEYHLRGLLLGLMSCITNLSDGIHGRSDEQL